MKKRQPIKLAGLLWSAILCTFIAFFISSNNYKTTEELARRAEIHLHKKEAYAKDRLWLLTKFLKKTPGKALFSKYEGSISEMYKKEGIAIYVYDHDSLCFWSDNQPAIDLYAYSNESDVQLIKIRNGWYEYIKQRDSIESRYTGIALIAIKPEYDFENKYINNNFNEWLYLPENTQLVFPINYLKHAVKSSFGPLLFEIYRTDGLYSDKVINLYASFFAFLACVFFTIVLFLWMQRQFKNRALFIVLFCSVMFILRSTAIYFKFPAVFYETSLYDATIYANASSFYFSYLGDVIINSFLIFALSIFVYKTKYEISKYSKSLNIFIFGIGVLLVFYFSYNIRSLIFSLVNNSTISYNVNEFFNISEYSLLGLLSISFLMFAFYLLIEKFVMIMLRHPRITRISVILFFIITVTAFLILIYFNLSISDYLWPVPLIVIAFFFRKYKASYNFINIGLIILASTLVITNLFYRFEQLNKQQNYEALSLSLFDRQDVIAENEFNKIVSAVKNDIKIKNLISLLPLSSDNLEQSIRQSNFSGYFERYEVVLSLFKSDCTPVFKNNDAVYLNEDYFKQQIEQHGYQTICDDLYYIDNGSKQIRYIAKIDVDDVNKNSEKQYRLYVQLEPKIASNLGAFPDLLLDKSLQNKLESKQISYAIYESNKLATAYGEYQYPLFIDVKLFKKGLNDGFSHSVFYNHKRTYLVISDKTRGFWQRFTSNSYLFVLFSVVVLFSALFNSIFIKRNRRFNSLNNRIQFIFVSVVVLSLMGVVIGTVWVVTTQFEVKNKKELISKSQSILRELQTNLGQQNDLDNSYKDYASIQLKKLSLMFGTDISLFNKKGLLFATSQPAIYEQGLLSKFMQPLALSTFIRESIANYSQKENIGQLNYLSAYIPFYNKEDKLLGYVNLPYFSRQKDLEKELTAYLTTLLNIYTILFVVTTLIALLVSNLLTKPLRIIKQQFSKVQFGSRNETLNWKSNDEIGKLVGEYNNMLVKLEKSSELLAQSERETAWREMAKQVAHEIKNPLTPMKLNIQHLKRVVDTNPDDINDRVHRVSDMLIDQIDTLSHIATEFSNFAKLPKANLEVLNVYDVLESVTDLFKQNTNCVVTLYATHSLFIKADKEQCLRVFTNLLKNAEQSIPDGREGKIDVVAFENHGSVRISVKDNGNGIPQAIQHKLFTPNFTTKSTGTGLGLAMAKNTIESFGGTITFVTEPNVGTTFIINMPAQSND